MDIKLTKYSHGSGCGCKISPKVLSTILETKIPAPEDVNLLVGNSSRDDAAVYDLGDGTAIISTTDFFMPIVDDPFTFGQIAATNAISDVYAMGGTPIMAIAILGWPLDKIPAEVAQKVLEGGRETCARAGITLAGGHSIDSPEPIFGLAVTGKVDVDKIKKNDTATEGCALYLTKPLGVGILSTAQKKGILKEEHSNLAINEMIKLNTLGKLFAQIPGIKALTDVTGFGLLGHLVEMCEGSNLSAQINTAEVPTLENIDEYISQGSMPGGTLRNWDSYGHNVSLTNINDKNILCDPQTSGGLLIAVEQSACAEVESILKENNCFSPSFGTIIKKQDKLVIVK